MSFLAILGPPCPHPQHRCPSRRVHLRFWVDSLNAKARYRGSIDDARSCDPKLNTFCGTFISQSNMLYIRGGCLGGLTDEPGSALWLEPEDHRTSNRSSSFSV